MMNHPEVCFGISRHNVIIPLKVINVIDYEDGCFKYIFEINYKNPTDYMKCHQKADFNNILVSEHSPLVNEFTKVRLTIEDAKELVTKQLKADRDKVMMKIRSIDKALSEVDDSVVKIISSMI